MQFSEYATAIRGLGREIDPETLRATRALVQPQIDPTHADGVHCTRDLAYGPHERQRLDVFTPESGFDTGRPVLVFVHGGGFVAGDKQVPGTPFFDNVACWAVRHGCNAVNLTYRLAPRHQWPAGIEDLHLALSWMKEQGKGLGLDAGNVYLMGQSAGAAHVAGFVAHPEVYRHARHRVRGLVLLSGIYDFSDMDGPFERAYLGDDRSLYAARSSLPGLVASGLPLLVSLAEHDPQAFEAQGLALLTAWQQRHGRLPWFVQARGQNHFSVVLCLGLPGDLVGPRVLDFIFSGS